MQDSARAPKRAFFKKKDVFIVVGILAAALALWLVFSRGGAPGGTAVVQVGHGDARAVQRLPLSPDRIVEIDAALPVRLEIRGGQIRFVDSACPDHDCERMGWLRHEGDWAACLPAGVVVEIE